MREKQQYTLIMMVENNVGVLTRIATQIRREGLNIKRLLVEESENPAVSRLEMTFLCRQGFYAGVLERFRQQSCVIEVFEETTEGK